MIIDLPRFISSEKPSWTELEQLLDRLGVDSTGKLTLEEAKRLHFLYQKVSGDLGRISTFASEPELRRYLESLVGRAYGEIHETRDRGRSWRLVSWFVVDFPRAFRRHSWAFWLSVWITIVGALFGGFAVALDDEAKDSLVPAQFSHLNGRPSERVAREEHETKDRFKNGHNSFAGYLMTNNIGVSIRAMAFGMTWGIGTILVLFTNGVTVGLVAVDYVMDGQLVFLLGWLMPHGVVEIPSILIAGQAGLLLGKTVIGRGDRANLQERLRAVVRDVALLIGGVSVMLVWAGIIESFLSQHHQPVVPYSAKIAFGTAELLLLIWFLTRAGSESKEGTSRETSPRLAAAASR